MNSPLIQWFDFILTQAENLIEFIINIDLGGMPLGSLLLLGFVMSGVFMLLEKEK